MNRILCILKDLGSGITLMKDANDTKNWTKRDLLRMRRKNLIKGYDVEYGNNLVVFDTSQIQYIYLVNEQPETVEEEDEESDGESQDEEHEKWTESLPEPKYIDRGENGVMFR